MLDLEDIRNNGVVINLQLTLKCNLECDHCGYSCSPTVRSGYMKSDVLLKVRQQVERLQALDIPVVVNLIGGEPTLNLNLFGLILQEVMTWGVEVEMTTNGWWLNRPATLKRFLSTVRRYVDGDGLGEGFGVRISGDQFHTRQGTLTHLGESLMKYLNNIWDGVYDWLDDDSFWLPPRPHESHPWLYVDGHLNYEGVVPIGRGADMGGYNERTCHENTHFKLTYDPRGRLNDICCRFSQCHFGTVDDDPILLLNLADQFLRSREPACSRCVEEAADWATRNLARQRLMLGEEIKVWEDSLEDA